jgi:hypothetical protein
MEKLLLQRSGKQELGTMGRFSCAAVAGTVSALIATPTELVIIQQQVRMVSRLLNFGMQCCSHSCTSASLAVVESPACRLLIMINFKQAMIQTHSSRVPGAQD